MKIVVIGGSGLIGSKLVTELDEHGHEAVAASPDSGVNTLTGDGLAEALDGAAVVIDVSRRTSSRASSPPTSASSSCCASAARASPSSSRVPGASAPTLPSTSPGTSAQPAPGPGT